MLLIFATYRIFVIKFCDAILFPFFKRNLIVFLCFMWNLCVADEVNMCISQFNVGTRVMKLEILQFIGIFSKISKCLYQKFSLFTILFTQTHKTLNEHPKYYLTYFYSSCFLSKIIFLYEKLCRKLLWNPCFNKNFLVRSGRCCCEIIPPFFT